MTVKEILNPPNNNITLIRLVLALMVIMGHTYAINPVNPSVDLIGFIAPFEYTGSFAVKLFFFLSGLLIVNSLYLRQNSVHYWSHRIARIFPGLLFVLVLSTFVVGVVFTELDLQTYFSDKETYKYIVKNMQLKPRYVLPGVFFNNPHQISVNGSLWSITWEFKCYIITYLVYLLSFKKYFRVVGTICFSLLGLQIIFFKHMGFYDSTYVGIYPLFYYVGAVIALNADLIKLDWKILSVSFVLLLMSYFFPNPYNSIFFITFFCFLALWLSVTKPVLKLQMKNDISYGVYLWGFVVQQSIHTLFPYWGSYKHMISSLIVSSIMGGVSWFLIEKPSMRLAKRISNLSLSKVLPF